MRRVIFNQKGGVGKSTIACNLAAVSANDGKRTLLVDLDSQCNATQYLLGSKLQEAEPTIADFFQDSLRMSFRRKDSLEACIHKTQFPGLYVLPSHPSLSELQGKLESRHKVFKLREAMNSLIEFDAVYIDTPPALNFYTLSALIAANTCLIPFDCDDFSRNALYLLMESVTEIQMDHNADLAVEGIIVNQYQARAKLPKRIVAELIEEGLPVLDAYLSASVKIRESHEKSTPMVYLDSNHKLALEYMELYRQLNPDINKGREIQSVM